VLAYWVRHRQALALEEGVPMLSFEPASAWGLHDRGLRREGSPLTSSFSIPTV